MGQTLAGGYYADADGKGFHDAQGRAVEKIGDKAYVKAVGEQAALTPEQLAAQSRQQQFQLAAEEAERNANAAAATAKAAQKEAAAASKKK